MFVYEGMKIIVGKEGFSWPGENFSLRRAEGNGSQGEPRREFANELVNSLVSFLK